MTKGYDHRAKLLTEENYVKMERVYLRPWQTFKTQTEKLIPYIKELVAKDSSSLDC
jgi:hypothetical protein